MWGKVQGPSLKEHREEQGAHFKFKVVRKCKTSLEMQVREAVRISMRGSVLNKKGMYIRCKLTRLVVDTYWEEKVWQESWHTNTDDKTDQEELTINAKRRSPIIEESNKRRKLDKPDGTSWGETLSKKQEAQMFLESRSEGIEAVNNEVLLRSGVDG